MIERVKKSVSLFEKPQLQKRKSGQSVGGGDPQLWLPDNLSGRILDLQFECQTEKLSKVLIDDLVELYSKAVQFYNERSNRKYKVYQKRMQMFLSNPRIEEILKGRTAKIIMAQEQAQEEVKQAESTSKQQAAQMLRKHDLASCAAMQKVQQDLQRQEQNLEQRIRRKRTNSNRSTKTDNQQEEDEFGRRELGQRMDIKLLLDGIGTHNKKVFF